MYTAKVIKHFQKPHNFGKIKSADAIGEVGNLACGDVMYLYLKFGKDKRGQEIISDIKFQTFGCAAAIATSSVITDLAKNKTLTEALEIDNEQIIQELGGLPPIKVHCSVLAAKALHEAIYQYLQKQGRDIPPKLLFEHQMIEKQKVLGKH